MSDRAVERALLRLAGAGAVLRRDLKRDDFVVLPHGDRRRRPMARLSPAAVRQLEAEGALQAAGADAYALSAAGHARARRAAAFADERYLAQHAEITQREVIDEDSRLHRTRALQSSVSLRRLAALRDAGGKPWLSHAEWTAAQWLHDHWQSGQKGLVRASDWTAPPLGSTPRGPSNAQERALAARCDARRRVEEALDALAPPLRRVIERACLQEDGLEAIERRNGWPPRSAKVALKLGLAQLSRALLKR